MTIWNFGADAGSYTEQAALHNLLAAPSLALYNQSIDANGKDGIAFTDAAGVYHELGQAAAWDDIRGGGADAEWIVNINTVNWIDMTVRFDYRGNNSHPITTLSIDYKHETQSTWTSIVNETPLNGNGTWRTFSMDLSPVDAIENKNALQLRFTDLAADADANDSFRFDNLQFSGTRISSLQPGDVYIIGYRTDTPDSVAFVSFVDLPNGAIIGITDRGWAGDRFSVTNGSENLFWWENTSGATMPAGSIVVLNGGMQGFDENGDSFHLFAGSINQPLLLFGLNIQEDGDTITSGQAMGWQRFGDHINYSMLADQLADAGAHLSFSIPEMDNGYYIGPRAGTATGLKAAIINRSNWLVTNDQEADWTPYSGSFTIYGQSATPELEISEIYFNPDGDDTGCEWVEVRNTGSGVIDFSATPVSVAWSAARFGESWSSSCAYTIDSGTLLPGGYAVFGGTTSRPRNGSPTFFVQSATLELENAKTGRNPARNTGVAIFSGSHTAIQNLASDATRLDSVFYGDVSSSQFAYNQSGQTGASLTPEFDNAADANGIQKTWDGRWVHSPRGGTPGWGLRDTINGSASFLARWDDNPGAVIGPGYAAAAGMSQNDDSAMSDDWSSLSFNSNGNMYVSIDDEGMIEITTSGQFVRGGASKKTGGAVNVTAHGTALGYLANQGDYEGVTFQPNSGEILTVNERGVSDTSGAQFYKMNAATFAVTESHEFTDNFMLHLDNERNFNLEAIEFYQQVGLIEQFFVASEGNRAIYLYELDQGTLQQATDDVIDMGVRYNDNPKDLYYNSVAKELLVLSLSGSLRLFNYDTNSASFMQQKDEYRIPSWLRERGCEGMTLDNDGSLYIAQDGCTVYKFNAFNSGDNIPDWWWNQYGFTNVVQRDKDADPDYDGYTTGEEYIAGTDPNSGTSSFLISDQFGKSGEDPYHIIRWSAIAGRYYTIDWSTNLFDEPAFHVLIEDLQTTSDGIAAYTNTTRIHAPIYYRIRVHN